MKLSSAKMSRSDEVDVTGIMEEHKEPEILLKSYFLSLGNSIGYHPSFYSMRMRLYVLISADYNEIGANIYDEFLGGSFTSDAYHMTEPHPEGKGVVLCIEKALPQSGVSQVHDRSPIRSSWSCGSCCT
ncbi:hypothetical protein MKW92_043501, partial [Papaver armeniacum]